MTPYVVAGAAVLFASICFGFVPYFSRGLTDQGLATYAVAFYRYILAAIVLLPVLIKYRSAWREIVWGMTAGAVMGLGWVGYVTDLETIPASTVGLLYMTYPVFTIIIARVFFGDPLTRRSIFAFGEVITGAQAVACILVLSAIALTQSRSTRTMTTVISKKPEV